MSQRPKQTEEFVITVLKEVATIPRTKSTSMKIRVVKFGENPPSVDVRQFYVKKSGDSGWGRGVSLTPTDFATLCDKRTEIEAALKPAAKKKAA